MLPINKRLDNDDHYDGGNNIQYIVLHDTGNVTDSDQGNANYFCTGTRNASAHYFVDDDSITQIVEDTDCSFHCGDGNNRYGIGNRNSIGIEMCRVNNSVTPTTEFNTIELVKYLMNKYNVPIDRVTRHFDASRKPCPSSFSANNWARWNEFKNKLVNKPQEKPIQSGEMFRVRKSWSDIKSQIGAYTVLDNAIELAKTNNGYGVFNSKGEQVYPVSIPYPTPQPQPVQTITRTIEGVGYCTVNVLNVRNGVGTNYAIQGVLNMNEKITILEKNGEWRKIRYYNAPQRSNMVGWVNANYLRISKDVQVITETLPQSDAKYGTVTATALNIRSGRGTGYGVIGQLKQGEKVKLLYLKDKWWSIDVPLSVSSTGVGFIHADYVK